MLLNRVNAGASVDSDIDKANNDCNTTQNTAPVASALDHELYCIILNFVINIDFPVCFQKQ